MKGLIFVYLMTGAGILGGLANPVIGLFAYVLFATLRPQFVWGYAGADFGGISQYVAIAMFVGWAVKSFGEYSMKRVIGIAAPLIFFAIWVFVSAQTAYDSNVANAWGIEFLKILAPFLVGITTLNFSKHGRWLLWVIVASHGYISLNMNQNYFFNGFNEVAELGFGGVDNNSFGVSLIAALGPCVALGLTAKKTPERAFAAFCGLFILHTIILTYSRGALTGLVVTLAATFFLLPKKPSYMAAVLVIVLVGARLTGREVLARFSTTFASEENRDSSAQSRVELWAACWDLAKKAPLTGVGPRNFPLVATSYGFTQLKEAHSTWMQTLGEMGFPGLLSLLAFYIAAIARLLPIAKRKWTPENKEETLLAAGLLASLAGFFVSAQFVTMVGLETPYYLVMVGAVLAAKVADDKARGLQPAFAAQPATSGIALQPSPLVDPLPSMARRALGTPAPSSPRRRFQWDAPASKSEA